MVALERTPTHIRSPVVVIGAGGHAKVVVSTLQATGYSVDAIYDDNPRIWGSTVLGVPIRGPIDELIQSAVMAGVIGIGDNLIRQRFAESLPLDWLTVVHPFSFVHPGVSLGEGTVVFAGAVVQPGSIIGRHSIINTCASIDHDCRIGSFTSVCPGTHLAGTVTVGERCLLGTGCSVIPNIHIANDVVVGAGTVVIRDLLAGCTLVGATPRVLRSSRRTKGLILPGDTKAQTRSAPHRNSSGSHSQQGS